jgi:two-component system sensor histidine kinase CreC
MVSVAKPQRAVFQFRNETRRWVLGQILAILTVMLLASFLLARGAARPIERLTRHARAIARGERPATPRLPGSDLHTLGEAFERMREELEGREYVENYIQSLTHELKSPVAAIHGAAELLRENPPPDQQAKFLANITAETRRLQDLVDRLLDLAALEKRNALVDPRRVDLAAVARQVIDHLGPGLRQRGLSVDADLAGPAWVHGDPLLIEGALINLVQNAADFSPSGGSIGVRIGRDGPVVSAVITDEGPGIPEFARDRVFQRFYSLPRPHSRKKSTGLGLCFVREIASLHRGSIALDPRPEGGTRAVLTFPFSPGSRKSG